METDEDLERYSFLQARALLMLVFMILHQLYWAATASEWANPFVYIVIGVEIICGGLLVAISAARASGNRWLYRVCIIALAVPWWLGILYIIYGVTSLAEIPFGVFKVRNSLGALPESFSFWWFEVSSLIAGIFWTFVGNSLRKDINGLAKIPGVAEIAITQVGPEGKVE